MKYGAGKFVKKSYKRNDKLGRDILIEYLIKIGHIILLNDENYKHDIITMKDNIKYYFEVEMKHNYPFTCVNDFIFDTVSYLGRKKKLHDEHHFKYIIICAETKYAVCCNSRDIYKEKYLEEKNIDSYERQGLDYFYRVPKELCYFCNMNID
jgi:hypothetical protein